MGAEIDSAYYLGNISRIEEDLPKAVAYLRATETPFAALVWTKEASTFKSDDMQVIEIDRKIDNHVLDTYTWLCSRLYLPNDYVIAKKPINFEKHEGGVMRKTRVFTESQKRSNLHLALIDKFIRQICLHARDTI